MSLLSLPTSFFRAMLGVFTLAGAVCGAPAGAAQAEPGARLLAVEKDGKLAFFLPESHIGTPMQKDPYFNGPIREAFAAASELLLERAASARLDYDYQQRHCAVEGPDEGAMDMELNAALRAHPDPVLERVMPLNTEIEHLGRFMRFELLLQAWSGRVYEQPAGSPAKNATTVNPLPSQSGRLMIEKPRPWRSIDDTATFYNAYCALAPAERSTLIRSLLDGWRPQAVAVPMLQPESGLRGLYRYIDALYRASLDDIRDTLGLAPATGTARPDMAHAERRWSGDELIKHHFLIAERNRAWVAQLPAVLATERLPFYAIGADHFADGPLGPGLITLLRRAGFHVALIDGRPMLRTLLTRLPAAARKPDAPASREEEAGLLTGKCVRIPGNYSCSWGDATTIYIATLPAPSSPKELLTVCYRRATEQGPLNQCVTATVPRAPQRVADLAAAEDMAPANPADAATTKLRPDTTPPPI
ncbi:hypothetical protein [Janthinobacterium sp. PC23-8]|uniref:hypothetical protein n=1 Tax=Janthinobacterium sp. PC23-8 TaxID=2012679 RepID=UPI000B961951|nr:hypothetical protein [Janthinobacterium sp. PC23-8]OYO30311.1 hypothetical protein CD932_03560 [Janthinobacterium sp. PC23-8]